MHIIPWKADFLLRSPLFKPFDLLQKYFSHFSQWPTVNDLESLKHTINPSIYTRSEKLICFVPQAASTNQHSQQYEPRIFLTGEIQTRPNNWHDFFNALVWITFPLAKAALNQIHFEALQHESKGEQIHRGSLRDAATLFDESGVIVICSDMNLINLLREHEWKQLFWERRKAVLSTMRFIIFGHGLYEKALNPYLGMTGKSFIFHVDELFLNQACIDLNKRLDEMLETLLLQQKFTSANLTPIPLLGYPGWYPGNERESFYDNKQYFRAHPSRRKL